MEDNAAWTRFLRWFAGTAVGLSAVVALFIALADPYSDVPFSPGGQRPMLEGNQRYVFPGLVRWGDFDSAILGNSTIRLLEPARLNSPFGARFAQLGMFGATAWEQAQMARLFLRHHPHPTVMVFGIDGMWCGVGAPAPRRAAQSFPDWMYDDNPWNDLPHLFNGKTLEVAGRVVGQWIRPKAGRERHGRDGYMNFLPPATEYDLARARQHIYGSESPRPVVGQDPPAASAVEMRNWAMPEVMMLETLIGEIPQETRLLFVFVPYHAYLQGGPGSRQRLQSNECKRRVAALASRRQRAMVLDFMIPSAITEDDRNYWDASHYTVETAARLADLLVVSARDGRSPDPALVQVPTAGAAP